MLTALPQSDELDFRGPTSLGREGRESERGDERERGRRESKEREDFLDLLPRTSYAIADLFGV